MSQERLKLTTKKSLYSPIEIEIDDQTYKSIKLTRDVRVKIGELNNKIKIMAGDVKSTEALYSLIQFIFNVKKEVLEKLDQRDVEQIYFYFNKRFIETEKERAELMKNTIQKAWPVKDTKKVKEKIPKNRKRPGDKA